MKKRENGITLIALVVTIVVLLILAGVSISMLTGENGIITQANEANLNNNHGTVLEALRLKVMEYFTKDEENLMEDKLILLKNDGIIDEKGIVNIQKLLEKRLSTGNGSGKKDVYIIKENHLYYYDENEEGIDLGNIGDLGNGFQETDSSYFEITKDNNNNVAINLKNYGDYYLEEAGFENWPHKLEEIIIPETLNGEKITQLGEAFCRNYPYVKLIYIPETITVIPSNAFEGCYNLETIIVDNYRFNMNGAPWGAKDNVKVIYKDEEGYQEFAVTYLEDKNQEELEELILKSKGFVGTYDEFLQERNLIQEAEEKQIEYIEYLKEILINDNNSWINVEYLVLKRGGEGKTIEELEQIYTEKLIGFPGSFDDFLTQEGMTREDFENAIKGMGFRTEEDFLKVLIYIYAYNP